MAVRAPGDYDPNTGWPPDDSTDVPWQNDVELPGQFKGGGAGFGPGGFQGNPRLTAPAAGPPPGISLSANPHGDGPTPITPDEVIPPSSRPIAPNKSVGPFTGGTSTDATFPPPSGRPWWLPSFGPIGLGAAAVGAGIAGINNENQPGNVPAHGTGPEPVMSPEEIYRRQHSAAAPSYRPEDSPSYTDNRTFPMWPTPPAPATAPATYPHMPWPDTGAAPGVGSAAPAVPPPRPSPAATRQRPNLGAYGAPPAAVANSPFTTFDRPNMSPQNSMQGRQGDPQMGMLDLSRLFSGGQPAPVAAAPAPAPASILARPDLAQRVPLAQTPLPPRRPIDEPPRKTVKSSSTSQGGGY